VRMAEEEVSTETELQVAGISVVFQQTGGRSQVGITLGIVQ